MQRMTVPTCPAPQAPAQPWPVQLLKQRLGQLTCPELSTARGLQPALCTWCRVSSCLSNAGAQQEAHMLPPRAIAGSTTDETMSWSTLLATMLVSGRAQKHSSQKGFRCAKTDYRQAGYLAAHSRTVLPGCRLSSATSSRKPAARESAATQA